jgi:general secretion pathway protein D
MNPTKSTQTVFPTLIFLMCVFTFMTPAALAQSPDKAAVSSSRNTGGQLVSIDFNNVDIGVFIKFISDLTKKNFVIDDRVKGKVSIISPGKITVDEAYTVFESVLEVHGYAAVPAGEIIKIVSSPEARTKNIKTRLEEESGLVGDSVVTQVIPLRYAKPDDIKRLFTPLVSKNSIILSYSPTNTLIITDVQSNIKRLMHILKIIDVTGVGQQIAIIPVEFADATKLVKVLSAVFKSSATKRQRTSNSDVTFVADERTNAIILLASEGETENIRQLIKSLDKETPKGQTKIHVYYLEHATAEDLAAVLQNLPKQENTKDKKGGKPTAPVISENVRITADKATNSLIINADMEDFLVLQNIIKKIDIPRAMVYIEALIMEVNVTKDLRLGAEWLAGGETSIEGQDAAYAGGFGGGAIGGDSGYTYTGALNKATGNNITSLAPGFSMGLFGESITVGGITLPTISALIQAYKKDRDVKILSTPQILTTDNQEAKIYVGKNIPFQTTATVSQSTSEVYNSFEYRDVGKTLTITPHISKDRMVRLELALEVSNIENTTDYRPTTLKRTIQTTAIVKDRNTVVLGGLIDDRLDTTDYKVPCLGDIPGLGWMFRSMGKANEKANLYIFLTPRVIQNSKEAKDVYSNKREEIESVDVEEIKLYPWRSKEPAKSPFPAPLEEPDEPDEPAPPATEEQAPTPESSWKKDTYAPIAPVTSANIGYTIQVTSVKSTDQASQLMKELKHEGYPTYTVRSEEDGQIWYRLRIGYYKNSIEAEKVMAQLRNYQFEPILIKL